MSAVARNGTEDGPCSREQAIELLTENLAEVYGATPDPEPDDDLLTDLDARPVQNLRRVIGYLKTLALYAVASQMLDPTIYRGLKMGGVALSKAFLLG